MNIRDFLKENILLFDGSMGTYCGEVTSDSAGSPCELLNISAPEKIKQIHKEYIIAGARAIKTNTFCANRISFDTKNCKNIIKSGWQLANTFADEVFAFADIGPISVTDEQSLFEEYKFVVDLFLECGAENFLFETNSDLELLPEISGYIKSKNPNAFIIVSFASLPDGFTRSGKEAEKLISVAGDCKAIDAVGLNCASGARHMAGLIGNIKLPDKYFSAMPNAGYPTVLGNRTFYDGSPLYFANQIANMANNGVKILGGCCGTTPKHISEAFKALLKPDTTEIKSKPQTLKRTEKKNEFWQALCDPEKRPIAVELDPPENSDISKFMLAAEELKNKGAQVITVADCPIGRARMDSSLLACKLRRELNLQVLPHITCRDRNLNAIKALLLGLCAEEVHNVLIVTGDPIPTADRNEVKSVYNFNSRMLAGYITAISQKSLTTPFKIFAALNVNAQNFDVQLKIAKEKEKNGVCGFLTQPILTKQALENLKKAKAELKGKILGGIFPIVSYKNACFMNSEVSGVKVDDEIIALYESKDREEAEALALEISTQIAKEIYSYVDGYYLMTPFSRTELMSKIMKKINRLC